jgi:23S rRNA (pseudouridine1915-N3)-methyltransferase
MKITIYFTGKKGSQLYNLSLDYITKAKFDTSIDLVLLNPSGLSNESARNKESQNILTKLNKDDTLWLLDEKGSQISSIELAQKIEKTKLIAKNISIIVGGAYGVNDDLKSKADFVWSLSNLVFPHELAWIILSEQIYRAGQINKNSGYHHA